MDYSIVWVRALYHHVSAARGNHSGQPSEAGKLYLELGSVKNSPAERRG